ncbi:CoA transferase, partial [Streptomyces sp. NPDC005069]
RSNPHRSTTRCAVTRASSCRRTAPISPTHRGAARSDIVVENFRAGTLAKYGLDHESLRELDPRLPPRNTTRSGKRPQATNGTNGTKGRPGTRPGTRTTSTGRRPANPRLLRQRLVVFVVVTLLVALGIAAAQGCQGPARGLGAAQAPGQQEQHAVQEQHQGQHLLPRQ